MRAFNYAAPTMHVMRVMHVRVLLLSALSATLTGCAFCGDELPCLADENCPPDLPSCVAGLCARVAAPPPGLYDVTALEPPGGTGDAIIRAAFAARSDDLAALVSVRHSDNTTDDLFVSFNGAGALLTETLPREDGELLAEALTFDETDEPAGVFATQTNVRIRRRIDGDWAASTPGPTSAFGYSVAILGGRSFVGRRGANGAAATIDTATLDGDAWEQDVAGPEGIAVVVRDAATNGLSAVFGPLDGNALALTYDGAWSAPVTLEGAGFAASLHIGESGATWTTGVFNGHGFVRRVDDEDAASIDLVEVAALAEGDFPTGVASAPDGSVHVVASHAVADGTEVVHISDESGAFVADVVDTVPFEFPNLGIAVTSDGVLLIGMRGIRTQGDGTVINSALQFYRRAP